MTDPWDERYIYVHLPWKNQPWIGKYISPMDSMGIRVSQIKNILSFLGESTN